MPKGIYIHHKGYIFSEEHRKNIGKARIGTHLSEEAKKKISLAHKGKKLSLEHIEKLRLFHLGHKPWNKDKPYLSIKGKNHWNWKGGTTSQNNMDRVKFRRTIQKQVFERDNYTCQLCGQKSGNLQVDHIQSWKDYVELRFSIANCRTLCMDCHYFITWGKTKPDNIKTWGHNLSQIKKEELTFQSPTN